MEIKEKERKDDEKRNKKNEGDQGECEKEKRNRSGVGILPTTTIIIIIIQCNSCSLMKRESAGKLHILSESSSIHSSFSSHTHLVLCQKTAIMVFERLIPYAT
jgi:hypothetical protein